MNAPVHSEPSAKPFVVEVISHHGGRQRWGDYPDEKAAATVAAKLCLAGVAAEFRDARQEVAAR